MNKIDENMIAACGMNCSLSLARFRKENICLGCRNTNGNKVPHCSNCLIANCEELIKTKSKFCYECEKFPCLRLKNLDKRYKSKYNMSMIDNLNNINKKGIDVFLKNQTEKWTCKNCKSILCVHRSLCLNCGKAYKLI